MAFKLTAAEIMTGIEQTLADIEAYETSASVGRLTCKCARTRAFLRDLLKAQADAVSPAVTGSILARLNGDLPPGAMEPTKLDAVWIIRVEGPFDGQIQYLPKVHATLPLALDWLRTAEHALRLVGHYNIEPVRIPVEVP